MRLLLEHGADIFHRRDGDGMTALCAAARFGFDLVVRTLLQRLREGPPGAAPPAADTPTHPTRKESLASGMGSPLRALDMKRAETFRILTFGDAHAGASNRRESDGMSTEALAYLEAAAITGAPIPHHPTTCTPPPPCHRLTRSSPA